VVPGGDGHFVRYLSGMPAGSHDLHRSLLAHNFYFKATLWPIAATRGCIVKRNWLALGQLRVGLCRRPVRREGQSVFGESSRARFSALRAANWVTSGSGSCIVVHRLDGSFPSRRMPTE
jgi:hypothetical protein